MLELYYGPLLFGCLFQPEIYKVYKEAFELALRDKGELQIKLFTDDAPPASVVEGAWQK